MDEGRRHETMESYLMLLDELKAKTGDARTAVALLQEVNKDVRMAQIRADRENGAPNGRSYPASPKQKNYLERLGFEVPADLTKKEASALIDEALAKESESDSFHAEPEPVTISSYVPVGEKRPEWEHYFVPMPMDVKRGVWK